MRRTAKDYVADYDPLFDALGGVGAAIPRPDFAPVPPSVQALAEEEELARPLVPDPVTGTEPLPLPRPDPTPVLASSPAPVRDPVDLMAQARQEAHGFRQRGAIGNLLDALVTGGSNLDRLSRQTDQQVAEALQAGREAQKREDLSVAQAQEEQQAQAKAQAASAASDPNSPQALALQASLRQSPMGAHLGEETIRRITPTNLRQYASVLQEAQREAAVSRRGRVAELTEEAKEKIARKYGKDKQQRAVEKAVAIAKGTEPIKTRIAKAGRADAAAIQLKMHEIRTAQQIKWRKEDQVRQLSRDLEATGILVQKKLLKGAAEGILSAKKEHGEIFSMKDEFLRRGGDWIAGWMAEHAQVVNEHLQTIQNMKLKDRSGAAVTPHEFRRLKVELGKALTQDEAALERSLDRLQKYLDIRERNIRAGYGEEVVAEHWRRFEEREFPNEKLKYSVPEGKVLIRKGKEGKLYTIPRENLEKAKARGYTEVTQ